MLFRRSGTTTASTGRTSTSSSSGRRGTTRAGVTRSSRGRTPCPRPQRARGAALEHGQAVPDNARAGDVPTTFLEPEEDFVAPDTPFVVKPSVGAGSIEAAGYEAGDDRARDHVRRLHAAGKTVMVQPFSRRSTTPRDRTPLPRRRVLARGSKAAMLPRGGDPGEGLFVEEQISVAEPSAGELDLAQRALGRGSLRARGPPVCPRRPPSGPGHSWRSSSPSRRSTSATQRGPPNASPTPSRLRAGGVRRKAGRALRRCSPVHGFDPPIPRVGRRRNLGNLRPWSRSPIPGAEQIRSLRVLVTDRCNCRCQLLHACGGPRGFRARRP